MAKKVTEDHTYMETIQRLVMQAKTEKYWRKRIAEEIIEAEAYYFNLMDTGEVKETKANTMFMIGMHQAHLVAKRGHL